MWIEPLDPKWKGIKMPNGESGSADEFAVAIVEVHDREGHPVVESVFYSVWDTPYLA